MADTVLTICQEVAEDVGIVRPLTLIGNNQESARRLLSAARRAIRKLDREQPEDGWQQLATLKTITTAVGVDEYALPDDYAKRLGRTEWDRTNFEPMYGPVSPADYQALVSSQLSSTTQIRRFFRIRGNKLVVFPVPTVAGETLAYEYVSSHLVLDTDGTTTKRSFAADTDTPRVPQDPFERFVEAFLLEKMGDDYAQAMLDAEKALDIAKARNQSYAPLHINEATGFRLVGEFNMPDTGYGGV